MNLETIARELQQVKEMQKHLTHPDLLAWYEQRIKTLEEEYKTLEGEYRGLL